MGLKVYPSVADIPGDVDLVIFSVRANAFAPYIEIYAVISSISPESEPFSPAQFPNAFALSSAYCPLDFVLLACYTNRELVFSLFKEIRNPHQAPLSKLDQIITILVIEAVVFDR